MLWDDSMFERNKVAVEVKERELQYTPFKNMQWDDTFSLNPVECTAWTSIHDQTKQL